MSALTLSGLGEMTARYASYVDLLASLRESSSHAGEELFRDVAFNIAINLLMTICGTMPRSGMAGHLLSPHTTSADEPR